MKKIIEYFKLTNKKANKYFNMVEETSSNKKFRYNPFVEKPFQTYVWFDKE